MIELIVALLVIGSALVIFSPVLAGRAAPGGPVRKPDNRGLEEQRATLRERKHRLLRSLKELETERAAGRVADHDYSALRERDQAEAARVIQQIESVDADLKAGRRTSKKQAMEAATPTVPARQRAARVAAWVGGAMAFGAVLAFTMSRAITDREPGGTITGTIPGGGGGAGGGASVLLPSVNPARLSELERIIQKDSSNVPALLEAGHLYLAGLSHGDPNVAEEQFRRAARVTVLALERNRDEPEGYAHIAVLLFAQSQSESEPDSSQAALNGALEAVNHALQLKPDLAEGWLFKGMISMAGLRDREAAATAWEQYLKVAPEGADTARIAAMVRAVKGR